VKEKSEIFKITSKWDRGFFEIYEDEGFGAFDEDNSIFIDSNLAELRKEEIESELNDLIVDTCFHRSEEDDRVQGRTFQLPLKRS